MAPTPASLDTADIAVPPISLASALLARHGCRRELRHGIPHRPNDGCGFTQTHSATGDHCELIFGRCHEHLLVNIAEYAN